MDWRRHWNEAPAQFADTDFLRQVGKTVDGQPISADQLDRLIAQLTEGLDLSPSDRVLDLCCGNGLITQHLARGCRAITGVDYSQPLIELARAHHQPPNASYVHASVLEIDEERLGRSEPFDKIYMYEALQHFTPMELELILERVEPLSRTGTRLYLGSVPDRLKLWFFYDTPARRADFERRVAEGREAIGTWWERSTLADIAVAHGFDWEFVDQHEDLHTAHYRFDALLTRRSTG